MKRDPGRRRVRDIVVRCADDHVMQQFRWSPGQAAWVPQLWQDYMVPVYPGGETAPKGDFEDRPAPDHWKWPLRCHECRPWQTRGIRAERLGPVLALLSSQGQEDVPIGLVDGCLARLPRRA
jgi:hypothetical protein